MFSLVKSVLDIVL